MEQLKALPAVAPEGVLLSDLVQRLAARIFADVASLLDTLPPPQAHRRTEVATWIRELRRQLAKLLVVVRWARYSDDVHTCMRVITFLQSIQSRFDYARRNLRDAVDHHLANARVRNYDLTTALDILDSFAPPPPLTDGTCVSVINQLSHVLRYRLAVHEYVPHAFRDYRIADGRVYLRVPGLFETALTADSIDPAGPWFMLHVKFLFEAYDHAGRRLVEEPRGKLRERVHEVSNSELAPRPTSTDDSRKDAPLVRIYNFLRSLTLDYELQALYRQCAILQRTEWAAHVSVTFQPAEKSLKLEYWTGRNASRGSSTSTKRRQQPQQTTPSTIHISIRKRSSRRSLESVLARLQLDAQSDLPLSDELDDSTFSLTWEPAGLSTTEQDLEPIRKALDGLNVQEILESATRKHIELAIKQKHYESLSSNFPSSDISLLQPTDKGKLTRLRVRLYGSTSIDVRICQCSGDLELCHSPNSISLYDLDTEIANKRLEAVAVHLNNARGSLPDAILRIKFMAITDRLEIAISSAGYFCTRQPVAKLRPKDTLKLGDSKQAILWIQLPLYPTYYVVFVVEAAGLRTGLASLQLSRESHLLYEMTDLMWLQRKTGTSSDGIKEHSDKDTRYDMSREEVDQACRLSTTLVGLLKVQRQLRKRGIAFQSIARKNNRKPPILTIKSDDVFQGSLRRSVGPQIGIAVFVSTKNTTKAVFKVPVQKQKLADIYAKAPNEDTYTVDRESGMFVVQTEDVDESVGLFVQSCVRIEQRTTPNAHKSTA